MADPISSPLRLALIGMSGTGKTFWSKRLAQTGRPAFCCDDRIEQRLRIRLGGGFTAPPASPPGWAGRTALATRSAKQNTSPRNCHARRSSHRSRAQSVPRAHSGHHRQRHLHRQPSIAAPPPSDDHRVSCGVGRGATAPHPALSRRSQAGLVARRISAQERRDAPRNRRALLSTLIAARRQSYEALAHCSVPVGELRDATLDAAAFLGKVSARLERAR